MPHRRYITDEEYAKAAANGIKRDTLNTRIWQHNWDMDKATTKRPQKQIKHSEHYKAMARSNGITETMYRVRVKQYGWTPQRAATEPPGHPESRKAAIKAAHAARGKYPKELLEEAASNGIARDTFYCRIKRGWPPEEAARHPPLRRQKQ
ncbi:hypothetical protein [Paenibacillus daejeonensis]|uniref:hypothetical protein n=1 Tax=Paenibacillus daejeonensis TaxID=135193 RepID=UPI000368E1C4|nr:hypothetical protein [Paenibacillus daejeonensis]